MSKSLDASGAINALQKAIKDRNYLESKLIHHSDRGLQYCYDSYQQLLMKNSIKCSMTESYDPYQNAIAEIVNGILKHEVILGITSKDLELMNKLIEQGIYIYYYDRPNWRCWMNTPAKMHLQSQFDIRKYKNKIAPSDYPMLSNILS